MIIGVIERQVEGNAGLLFLMLLIISFFSIIVSYRKISIGMAWLSLYVANQL
jgi:hypothetical protein